MRIAARSLHCNACGGSGKQGLFGPRGLGLLTRACSSCSEGHSIAQFQAFCSARCTSNDNVHGPALIIDAADVYSEQKEKPLGFDTCDKDDAEHALRIYLNCPGSQRHPTGDGFEEWPDGAKYDGQYRDGRKHGSGLLTWPDGSAYRGEFIHGDLSGIGTFRWNCGCSYTGQWESNSMHGIGVFSWRDGRSYEGQYSYDQRSGHGVYCWPDGCTYEGQWQNGTRHGIGTDNSQGRAGEWHRGRFVG